MTKQLKEENLIKVVGGVDSIPGKVSVSFVGKELTVICDREVKKFHLSAGNYSTNRGPIEGVKGVFESARQKNAVCKYTIKITYIDESKKTISFENPSDPYYAEFN